MELTSGSTQIILALIAQAGILLVLVINGFFSARAARKTIDKIDGVHVLVNDQLTREKQARLLEMKTNVAVLRKLLGPDLTPENSDLIVAQEKQIIALTAEIAARDAAAATLSKEQK